MHIYDWFCRQQNEKEKRQIVKIPIQIIRKDKQKIPVRQLNNQPIGLSPLIIDALGGSENIESYRCIPNSKRIRLTLLNPDLVDNKQLRQMETRLFIRIGKKIIHIIP